MATALQKMRIIAVPLTRPRRTTFPVSSSTSLGSSSSSQSSTNAAKPSRLTYYQFQITAKKKRVKANEGDAQNPEKKEKKGWLPEEGLVNFATQKAANIWAGFGKAEGGWRLKTFQFGERLVDRMEFEELALKSIDPSLGPSIRHLKQRPLADEKGSGPPTIPLIFPPSIITPSMALSELKAYTAHRIPRHRRGFWGWMLVAPFTAPFMIIPYRSSKYLQSLIEHDVIAPEASEALDEVYKLRSIEEPTTSTSSTSYSPSSSSSAFDPRPFSNPTASESSTASNTSSQTSPCPEPKHDVLLTRDAVPSILAIFELKPGGSAATDLYRAIEQARLRVASGREEL